MAFTTTMTTVSDVDGSVIQLWDEGVLLGYTPELVVDQVATIQKSFQAKTFTFTKFDNLALATSALTEDTDATSVALVDTQATLVPVEYGNVVTTTALANFQSGGKADRAAAVLVGRNMGATIDKLGVVALEAFSTTVIYPNGATSAATLGNGDVLDKTFANRLYNKLARLNVPGISGTYVGIAHEDCLYDLRESMVPVLSYTTAELAMQNEVGMYAGIRWLRSSNVAVTANSNGTIDSYKVNVVGQNALGLGIALPPQTIISGPYDKLQRFLNLGWKATLKWGVIDTANMVQGICMSSVGAN